jgi:hypothetical protein
MNSKIVQIDYDALADLLLASHASTTYAMSLDCPSLYKDYLDAQDKARQALKWGEYGDTKARRY